MKERTDYLVEELIDLLKTQLVDNVSELKNTYDRLPIPTAEHTNNFNKIFEELSILTTQPTCDYNKEGIKQLSTLTAQEINDFNLEEATACLESFNHLNEVTTKTWDLFKLSDIQATDQRALEIMTNMATSDADIEAIKKLKTLSQKISFFNEKNPLVDESKLPMHYKLKALARVYLDYREHKTQLENNQELVTNRVLELLHENAQSSICNMQ